MSRAKVVDVVVKVVTGLAKDQPRHEVHVLRISESGNSPAVTHADGAVCWRAALRRDTPSARRLYYWVRGDVVELSRLVAHDDMTP